MAASDSTHTTAKPQGFGNNKGIKFMIRTGSNTWTCSLQDRDSYERTKAAVEEPKPVQRSESFESSASSVSTSSH